MIYEGYGDHRGRTGHALVFYCPANGSTNADVFFSLKPFLSQGESSLKISACWGSPFGGVRGKTNKQTHSLTDRLPLL